MKLIGLFFVLVSCASYHAPLKPKKGDSFESVVSRAGQPQACLDLLTSKYCKWTEKNDVFHFQDGKFEKYITAQKNAHQHVVNVQTVSLGTPISQKVGLASSLSMKSLEWKKNGKKIEKLLTSFGYQVTAETPEATINVDYGTEPLTYTEVKASLVLSASNTEGEVWQMKASLNSFDKDMDRLLPVLLTASNEQFREGSENSSKTMVVSERDFSYLAIKDFVSSYQ